MNVLVVGGAGYIGGAVTDELLSRHIPFTVLDNLTYNYQYLKPVPFIFGDVRDYKQMAAVIEKFTHVIWLAAIVGDGACRDHPELSYSINVQSLFRLLNGFENFYDRRLIYASSCSVYGYNEKMLDEDSTLNPQSRYAEHKISGECIVRGRNAVALRFGTAYGRSDAYSRMRFDLCVNRMAVMAAVEGRIEVHGGEQWRPWVSVQDIAYAIAEALSLPEPGTYNIITANLQIEEVASLVANGARDLGQVEIETHKSTDPRDYRVSAERALGEGLISPIALKDIPTAAAEIAGITASRRVADWTAPIHNNEAWLRRTT